MRPHLKKTFNCWKAKPNCKKLVFRVGIGGFETDVMDWMKLDYPDYTKFHGTYLSEIDALTAHLEETYHIRQSFIFH